MTIHWSPDRLQKTAELPKIGTPPKDNLIAIPTTKERVTTALANARQLQQEAENKIVAPKKR